MSTPETSDLMAAAVMAGLVTAREVADGGVEVRGTTLLLHGRRIAFARRADTPELQTLRQLAESGVVPDVIHRGAGSVAWTAVVHGTPLQDLTGVTMAVLAETCQAWGTSLAVLHRSPVETRTDPPVAPRPWVLDPDRLPRSMRVAPVGSARAFVLRMLRSDRGLQRTVARVADRWTADRWTHNELTAGRVLVQDVPEVRVRFVDLSRGGLGDQGWDLAGALETISALTAGPRAPWGTASGACLSDYLVQGYRRAGGQGVVDGGTRALRIVARAWDTAVEVDARAGHPASMHPAAGQATEASRLSARLTTARELAARSARTGLLAA